MKIYETLRHSKDLLKNSDTPSLDAEVLLSHVLGVDRIFLFLNYNMAISQSQEQSFLTLLNQRIKGMPIAHLIQLKYFWKLPFIVNKHTLVPRPDSETMIESFCAIYKNKRTPLNLAELGTGTGCLLISIINEYKNIIGYGLEKMQEAFFITRKNIIINKLANKIKIFYNNWNNVRDKINFDVIISNPPYIKRGEIKNLSKEVSTYEPKTALDGGITGLESYEEIFKFSSCHLKKNGLLFLEIGVSQYKQVYLMGIKNGLKFYNSFNDLSGITRVIVFRKLLHK